MRFTTQQAAGDDYYLMAIDLDTGDSWDFAAGSPAWAAFGTGTGPFVALTEVAAGSISEYFGDVDLTALFTDMDPHSVMIVIYTRAGGSPNFVTDVAIDGPTKLRLVGGHVVPDDDNSPPFAVSVTGNLTINDGTSMHLTAELVLNGQTIDLATLDAGATCAFDVTQDATTTGGARVAQFTIASGTVGAANASSRFEAEYANPDLAANRGFTILATIVAGGVTYTGSGKIQTA